MICLRLVLMVVVGLGLCLSMSAPSARADAETTDRARKFLKSYDQKIRPLEIAAGEAWWRANISGKDEDFAKKVETQDKIDAALADPAAFKELKTLKESGQIDDPVTARAIDVVYLTYLQKQVKPELLKQINEVSNKIEKAFNEYRAKVADKVLTENDVRQVLKQAKNVKYRQAVWEASKQVGAEVEADLKRLVKLRNEAARELGFKNYHALQLYLSEQDEKELMTLFDELDELTAEPFAKAKREIDGQLARLYSIAPGGLMPWHYHDPFFQQTPAVFAVNIDAPYEKADLLALSRDFYNSIALPIQDVVARSDLQEKKGKSPHAFCIDVDRDGDVRVLANIAGNEYWMSTLLHEFGHAVYSSKNIPAELPYPLRCEAHILTTEGIAMMFERLAKKRAWLEKMGVKVPNPKVFDATASKMQKYQLLIFSRWCQVMLRFEKGMYENPDQNLNDLWWSLVEKYQLLKRPKGRNAPDYASKIHIVSAPVYYHNYMMGELFASQLHHAIAREVYNDAKPDEVIYFNNEAVGKFLKDKVFAPGKKLKWNDLTKFATGAPLSAKAFAEDFKDK